MKRDEAIRRELHLVPQWTLRSSGAVGLQRQSRQNFGEQDTCSKTSSSFGLAGGALPSHGENGAKEPDGLLLTPGSIDRSISEAAEDTRVDLQLLQLAELDWPQLKRLVRDCRACGLRAGCTQSVFGVGDENADWLFVGEGPGAEEDLRGEPFVGQAGKLLDSMLAAINLKRGENVYIANIVKCRPPGNRTPEADEIARCLPYLRRQIELIQPKIIVALGKVASSALLGGDAALASLRGKQHAYHRIPVIVTYHPAYLLRSPLEKAKAWADLRLAVETLREAR